MDIPDLHDGTITGLRLIEPTSLRVDVSDWRGNRYAITLTGLQRLKCLDFREGNIILDVDVYRGVLPPESALREVLNRRNNETSEHMKNLSRSIEVGDMTLLNITPSYGCEVIAICSDIYIEKA